MVGELQYELLLGIFWENLSEPASFGDPVEPLFPYGRPLPPAPPQTQVLGVDKSKPPTWKVDVNVRSVNAVAEKLPPVLHTPGCGPDLGRVSTMSQHVISRELATVFLRNNFIIICSPLILHTTCHYRRSSGVLQPRAVLCRSRCRTSTW